MFEIAYHHLVVKKDVPRLSSFWKEKICSAIKNKLTLKPEVFGKPLRRSLRGYWKLRVGDYRIIYRIEKTKIKILVIRHRSVVYDLAVKRT